MIATNGSGDPAKGTHGTLSPFDLHNTFIAAGPDFRRGLTSEVPTSNLDVAATIVRLLCLTPAQPLNGRIVTEGMTSGDAKAPAVETKTLVATRDFSDGRWRQYLRTSTVGTSVYFDEGNGAVATGGTQTPSPQ